jgi:dDENN domain
MRFDNETFIESQPSHYRTFVQKIVELQVFQQFIEERLRLIQTNTEVTDEFEIEVELHAARMGKKMVKYKEFMKNIRGRANPAMKNMVKNVKTSVKELKQKIKENANHPKSDKLDYLSKKTYVKSDRSALDQQYRRSFQQFYPNGTNGLSDSSPSTSSSQSSSSEMNILQELEAQGIFNSSSGLDSNISTTSTSRNEDNLIDLNDCNNGDMAQFDPLENADLRRSCTRDPFEGSELLSDVIQELSKSTVAPSRNNWTKFD